jgi:hypothetical protein
MNALAAVLLVALLAGCASIDGRGLEPGKAREADVVARMGAPTERLQLPGGDSRLYFSRLPDGRRIYAATLGPDGLLKGLEQTLTLERIRKLAPGATSAKEVRELLGPPYRIERAERRQRDVWTYPWLSSIDERRVLWLYLSYDGVLREVTELHDFESDSQSLD